MTAAAIVHKALGAALVLTGLAVGGYFLVFELYAGQGDVGAAYDIWTVLNWIMAVAVIVMALVAWAVRRELPADADPWERLAASVRFYGALALLLMFFNAWFATRWSAGAVSFAWIVVDVTLAILAVNIGLRLWRTPRAED